MTLAIVIPAAGNSSRLGQPKQLVQFQGQPLLLRQITLCAAVGEQVYCVLGAHGEKISAQVAHQRCRFWYNPQWQQGLSGSIACAVERLPKNTSAVMIVLGDQWALEQQDLNRLIHSWQRQPDKIHAAYYHQQTGVPAIFPASCFSHLSKLSGKNGAKQLLTRPHSYGHQLVTVSMHNALADLDTPLQLQQLIPAQDIFNGEQQ